MGGGARRPRINRGWGKGQTRSGKGGEEEEVSEEERGIADESRQGGPGAGGKTQRIHMLVTLYAGFAHEGPDGKNRENKVQGVTAYRLNSRILEHYERDSN